MSMTETATPSGATEAAGQAASSATQGAGDTAVGAISTFGQADGFATWGNYFQALGLLFLIVALLWAALWYLKRRGGFKLLTRQGDLSLESRLTLGPKKSLIVVRFLNKRVLLGVTDQQITMLTELPTDEDDTEPHASVPEKPAAFKTFLDKAGQRDNKA